ncbi:MAG TPA: ATP-binding protein [Candidatus Binatia bacterium]|nr:ATP-binding protein [Candidatus Binatia bacterium]
MPGGGDHPKFLARGAIRVVRVSAHLAALGKRATQECPCGFFGDPQKECTCNIVQVQRYRARISGPLLDRIDIQIEVPAVKYKELADRTSGEPSTALRERVERARQVQLARFGGRRIFCNAQMAPRDLKRFCAPESAAEKLLETAMTKLGLSARAYTRILKVARTIADLDGAPDGITASHVAEAIQYRSLDRAFH